MIYLLRHGTAEDDDGTGDAGRRLTAKGRDQSVAAGRAMKLLGFEVAACLSSPKVRAADTARLTCEVLGLEVELAPELGGGPIDPSALAAGRGDVLIVAHEPDLSDAVALVTGSRIKLKKGGLAVLDGRLLYALLRPPELRAIAAGA